MKCDRVRELFSDYLEAGTDYALSSVVRPHLDQCVACRQEFDLFSKTYAMLGELPEVDLPYMFRHDVVMKAARLQHERSRAKHRPWALNWDHLFGRLVPARAAAIVLAGIALALLLIRTPQSVYDHVKSTMFGVDTGPVVGSQTVDSDNRAPGVSDLGDWSSPRKQEWVSRKLQRNTLWVSIRSKGDGEGRTLYKVIVSINPDALPEGQTTARIAAQVYLLPRSRFDGGAADSTGVIWRGSILANAPLLVPVIVDRSLGMSGSVNLLLTWNFRGRNFAKIIYVPSGVARTFERESFDFPQSKPDLYSTLQSISEDYGVPIIANAYLKQKPSAMQFDRAGLDDALRVVLDPIGLDWLLADGAVYVDRQYLVAVD